MSDKVTVDFVNCEYKHNMILHVEIGYTFGSIVAVFRIWPSNNLMNCAGDVYTHWLHDSLWQNALVTFTMSQLRWHWICFRSWTSVSICRFWAKQAAQSNIRSARLKDWWRFLSICSVHRRQVLYLHFPFERFTDIFLETKTIKIHNQNDK